ACEVSQLEEAGLAQADVVAAVTGDDEDNLVVSLLAKQEFGVPRVVARVNHPKNEWLFNETWGVDVSVSTPHLLTALVEEAVTVGTLVRLLQFDGGKGGLEEGTLAEEAPAAGEASAGPPLRPDAAGRGDAGNRSATGEHGDGEAAAVVDRHLERRAAGAGHDADAGDLTGDAGARAQRGVGDGRVALSGVAAGQAPLLDL